MTQEEKDLLKDLSTRLPYSVQVNITYSKEHGSSLRARICSEGMLTLNTDLLGLLQEEEICLKPYLRPMSSMTKVEKKELENYLAAEAFASQKGLYSVLRAQRHTTNYLYSKHFDILGLIEKGLAIEAPEGIYK